MAYWNHSNILAYESAADEIVFGAGSGAAGPVTIGTVNANKITFATPGSGNYSLTGGTITLGGTAPAIAVNVDASIGSVLAGMAAAVGEMPWLTVVGIEPEGAATLYEAWQAGGPVDIDRLDSYAADALGARRTGDLNYALARQHVARVELVTDDDIRAAQRFLWEEVQLVAEPGGAAALAGLLSGKARVPEGARVGVLVCGGNAQIDLEFTTPLDKMKVLGVRPQHHTFGLPDARLIAPGRPECSVLLHRVSHRGAGQMPPLATSLPDLDGVRLLREWVKGMGRVKE